MATNSPVKMRPSSLPHRHGTPLLAIHWFSGGYGLASYCFTLRRMSLVVVGIDTPSMLIRADYYALPLMAIDVYTGDRFTMRRHTPLREWRAPAFIAVTVILFTIMRRQLLRHWRDIAHYHVLWLLYDTTVYIILWRHSGALDGCASHAIIVMTRMPFYERRRC